MPTEQMTFTVVLGGKGLDPSLPTGYQIKGCSPGLRKDPALRGRLASICTHYGHVVYDAKSPVIVAAMRKESAWYRRPQQPPQAFGPQVLDEFPVVWSYTQLDHEFWSITRTCYRGPCPDGKPGNFFSHALVFRPEELRRHGYNPLALCRSGMFMTCDEGDSNELPSLADLGNASSGCTDLALLDRSAWQDHIGAILLAMARARTGGRPAVLCMPNWREVPAFVEGLLALLPPSTRCRTAICTFENDPHWMPQLHDAQQRGATAAHHLLVLCGDDDKIWNLYAEDYGSRFAVFNFVGGRFSQLSEARVFAAFTVDCLQRAQFHKFEQYHRFMERFNIEADVDKWNQLAQVMGLIDVRLRPQELPTAADALVALAKDASQAAAALDILLPWVPELAATEDHEALRMVATRLVALADRMPAEFAALQPVVKMIRPLAAGALAAGRGRLLAALLQGCGAEEDTVLLELAKNLPAGGDAGWKQTADVRDQDALYDLLRRALELAWTKRSADPMILPLLVHVFRAAKGAAKTMEAWRQDASIVRSVLQGPWDEQRIQLIEKLACYLAADVCPQGHAWLSMELLVAEEPEGKELLDRLQGIAEACGKCPEDTEIIARLLGWVGRTLKATDVLAVALGRIAEVTVDATFLQKVLDLYRRAKQGASAEQLGQVRRQLAAAGAAKVLLYDVVDETRPWSEGGQKKLQSLLKEILGANPNILSGLCGELGAMLGRAESREHALILGQQLIKFNPRPDDAGIARLLAATVDAIPFGPLPDEYRKLLADLPGKMKGPAVGRLGFMKFMADIDSASTGPGWSLAQFAHEQAAWRETHCLSPCEIAQVGEWCEDHLLRLRVETPADALHFVDLLQAVGRSSAEQIIELIQRMIKDRDPVTLVNMATAFTYCDRTNSRHPAQTTWAALRDTVLATVSRKTNRLYKAHLAQLLYQPAPRRWRRTPSGGAPRATGITAAAFLASRTKPSGWRRLLGNRRVVASVVAGVLMIVGGVLASFWFWRMDAKAYYQRGKVHAAKGELTEARVDYSNAIRLEPEHSDEAYRARAEVFVRMDEPLDAIKDYSVILQNGADALWPRLAEMDKKGDQVPAGKAADDLDGAIEDYLVLLDRKAEDKVSSLAPRLIEVYKTRAGDSGRNKKYVEAVKDLSAVFCLEKVEDTRLRRVHDGKTQYTSKMAFVDYTDAMGEVASAVADFYRDLGDKLKEQGEYKEAIKKFTYVIQLNPNDAAAYQKRGDLYKETGEEAKAKADFAEADKLKDKKSLPVDRPEPRMLQVPRDTHLIPQLSPKL